MRFVLFGTGVAAPLARLCLVVAAVSLGIGASGCGTPPEEPPRATHYMGFFGGMGDDVLFGWAMNKEDVDHAVSVSIYDSDVLLGTVKADKPRKDLRDQNIGTGNYGFDFPIPSHIRDGKPHTIHVRITGSSYELQNSPRELTFSAPAGG